MQIFVKLYIRTEEKYYNKKNHKKQYFGVDFLNFQVLTDQSEQNRINLYKHSLMSNLEDFFDKEDKSSKSSHFVPS